jgi:hypothetical protein
MPKSFDDWKTVGDAANTVAGSAIRRLGCQDHLACQGCGGEYMHHIAVDIHCRPVEDAETLSHRAYGIGEPTTANPSSRRDGLVITLACEHCETITLLQIYQHKGVTYIEKCAKPENWGPEDGAVKGWREKWNVEA